MWASHLRSSWVRSRVHQTTEPCSSLSSLLPQISAIFPSLPLPAFSPSHFLCPTLNQSLSLSLLLTHARSHSLALSLPLGTSLVLTSVFLCVPLSISMCGLLSHLSLSFFLSFYPYPLPPPNSAASTSPIFNCLNCLFCGWAVIKRYLGYSPLGLRSGLPGSPDHKGHSWVE